MSDLERAVLIQYYAKRISNYQYPDNQNTQKEIFLLARKLSTYILLTELPAHDHDDRPIEPHPEFLRFWREQV